MSNSTAVQWSPHTPVLPPGHVLSSGAVIFPGAFDQHGCPLVVFPVETQTKLVRELAVEEVSDFIHYFLRLHNKSREECLVSVVADLRDASPVVSRHIAESLLLLEARGRAVHSLYVVLPRQRDATKHLNRLLPSRGSRAHGPTPFKCIFLKDVFDLSKYIDRSQLTASLGGYLVYCHESWVTFVKEMDGFAQKFVAVVQRLPVYIAALQDVSRLPVPVEAESLALFCSAHQTRLQQLRRNLGLDDLLRLCEQILEKFRCPESDPCYQAMVGTHLSTHTALEMLQNYDRITAAVAKVELLWQQAFSKASLQLQVLSLQREAKQVRAQMDSVQQGMLRVYRCEAAWSSSRAGTLWQQFEASVYMRAMALVHRAEDVMHAVAEVVPVRDGLVRESWIRELEQETDRFRTDVELVYKNLRAACDFHHYYAKVQCWYSLAVCENFLQDLLWSRCWNGDVPSGAPADSTWRPSLELFLRLHPCPQVEELLQLVNLARTLPEGQLQDGALRVAHRCMTLRKLMTSPGSATLRDLQLALQWKYEHLRGNHETMTTTSNLTPGSISCAEGVCSFPSPTRSQSPRSPHCASTVGLPKQDLMRNAQLFPSGTVVTDSAPVIGKPPSLSSFDSGFDCARSSHLEPGNGKEVPEGLPRVPFNKGASSGQRSPPPQINEESVSGIPSVSDQEQCREESGTPHPCIHIVPSITADSLSLEIQVKRSASPPQNPWLSLPVEDLENSYTVTISPRQQKELCSPVLKSSRDQPTQTDAPRHPSASHTCHSLEEAALSPIRKVLSSTITDGADGTNTTAETTPTLLWDTYDLHDLKHDSSSSLLRSLSDASLGDWELKEEAELQAVEEILHRTAGILQEEEENALAEEEALGILLQSEPLDRKWSAVSGHIQLTQMSSSDLAEAGVIGLEDHITSPLQLSSYHDVLYQGYPHDPADDSAVSPGPVSESPCRGSLLQELKNLQVLDRQIMEENLKLCDLHHTEETASVSSVQSFTEDRRRFLEVLEREKREVEEMERNLSREIKNKGRQMTQQGTRHKVIKCSIMERVLTLINMGEEEEEAAACDEPRLVTCRHQPQKNTKHLPSSAQKNQCVTSEESTSQQPSYAATDQAVHCKVSAEVLNSDAKSTNNCLNFSLDTCQDPLCSSVLSDSVVPAAPSVAMSECHVLNPQKRNMPECISAASDLFDAHASIGRETEKLLGPAEHAQSDGVPCEGQETDTGQCYKGRTVTSNTQVEEGWKQMVLEAGEEQAFDPGGTGPQPRLPRSRRPLLHDQSDSVSEGDLEVSSHDPGGAGDPTAPSIGPKPKEHKNPPCSKLEALPAILGHDNNNNNNNNNNNPCFVDQHLPENNVGSQVLEEFITGSDCVNGDQIDTSVSERVISGMECQPCKGLISGMECQPCKGLISGMECQPCKGLISGMECQPCKGLISGMECQPCKGLISGMEYQPCKGLISGMECQPRKGLISGTESEPRKGLISGTESEPRKGLISGMESEPCKALTLETKSGLFDLSGLSGECEESKASAAVTYDVSTRTICRSPELHIREMSDFLTPVVLDTGSGLVKAGFADLDLPTTVFPTAIGRPKYEEVMSGSTERDVYVGHEVQHMRGVLTLHYPMRNGIISNWDHMEMIWQHAFQQLRVDPEDHPVLLTEAAMIPQENRQRMVQLMFECFNVPLTYVALQPVLALYAAGRTTGLVFDSGDGASHSVPVFDGYCLPHAVQRLPLAGADVTLRLKELLLEQGLCMRTSAELEIVREIKERCCCVALDYEAELIRVGEAGKEMHYTLPDGRAISLTTERFRASEILFKPELVGRDHYGMHESIFKSILQSDIDLRKSLLGNVVLSGGNTLLTGLCERLQQELSCLAPADGSVRVLSPPQRDFSVWRGGAVLSCLPTFSSAWISHDEYEEFGPQIVFRKCF